MSVESPVAQQPVGRRSQFRKDFQLFVKENMIFNDPDGSVLDLARSMLFKTPNPKSMHEFLKTAAEPILEDIKKYSKIEARKIADKKETMATDSKDPSYNKDLQKQISQEYDQDEDGKENDDFIENRPNMETKSENGGILKDKKKEVEDGIHRTNSIDQKSSHKDSHNGSRQNIRKGLDENSDAIDEDRGRGLPEHYDSSNLKLRLHKHGRLGADDENEQSGEHSKANLVGDPETGASPQQLLEHRLRGPLVCELLLFECDVLRHHFMIEPILDYREYAVPKLIKKEFLYRKIQKRVWPLSLELKLFEGVYIDSQKNLRVPVPIPHAQARKVDFYVSAQQLSARKAKAGEQFKTKRERERDLINELRTDTQANMQVLLDRNGREMQIESDDNEADDDSEQELANERRLKAKLEGGKSVKSKKTAAREQILREKKKNDLAKGPPGAAASGKKQAPADAKKGETTKPFDGSAANESRSSAPGNPRLSRSRVEDDKAIVVRDEQLKRRQPGRIPLGENKPERNRGEASVEGPGDSSSRENLSLVLAHNRSNSRLRSQLEGSSKKIRVRPKQAAEQKKLPAIKISEKSSSKPFNTVETAPLAPGHPTAEASAAQDATGRGLGEPDDGFLTSKTLKQFKAPREAPSLQKDAKTAKKKKQVVSPYDLEYNNKFLKNTFQLELIMDLEEQRRTRPTEYRIRNFKKGAKHQRKKGQLKEPLKAKRSDSPEPDRLPEELSSGKSASHAPDEDLRGKSQKGRKPQHFSSQANEKNKLFNMLAEQPKHLRDPLKFSKPFEIKASGFDRQKKDPRGRKDPKADLPQQEVASRIRSDDEDAAVLNQTASTGFGRLRPLNRLETPLSKQREKMYLTQGNGFRPKPDQDTIEAQRNGKVFS